MTVTQRIAAWLLAFGLAIVAPAMPQSAAFTAPLACSTAAFQANRTGRHDLRSSR
jgi:hypothetical protein